MPHQRPPEPGRGDVDRGAPGSPRPVPPNTTGRPVSAADAPNVPRQRRAAPSRPPHGGPGVPPDRTPGGQRPTRVVPGPGLPPGTPPGGQPPTRAMPGGPTELRPAAGPGRPNGPLGGGPNGGGPNGGDAAAGSAKGSGTGSDGSAKETSTLKESLSPTDIAAGAGASVVSAILGSFLGAIGTVLGAALGSVIYALVSAFLTRGLEQGRDKALELKDKAAARKGKGVAAGTAAAARESSGRESSGRESSGRGVAGPTGEETVRLDPSRAGRPAAAHAGGRATSWFGGLRRVRPTRRTIVVSAVAGVLTFGVAMFLITGIEVVKGSSLAGHSSGTSIGNVVRGGPPPAPADDGDEGTGTDSSSTSESSTSTGESESSAPESSSGTSTEESEPSRDGSGSGSEPGSGDSGNPLGDTLNRVVPTQDPGSGSGSDSGQQGRSQQDGGDPGSGSGN